MRIELSGSSNYYENHHILPKSLDGNDDNSNLVLLTPREHFICHWLLVKIYNKGTDERKKMLYAFWRMRCNPSPNYKRYINSRAYEKLKIEYVQNFSSFMKEKQKGSNNSNFGKHWYTNRDTGENKHFKNPPNEKWIKGKNLFAGQTDKLPIKKYEHIKYVKELWNLYHNGNYSNVEQFCKQNNVKDVRQKFRRIIPYFKRICETTKHNRFDFPSNKNLVGVFE